MKQIFKVLTSFLIVVFFIGCATEGDNARAKKGTLLGALGGAAVGGLIGSQSGKAGQGALIGGLVGALGGGLIGNYMDKQAAELEKVAETQRTEDGIIVTMKDKILFDVNKAELKPESKNSLSKIADVLRRYPKTDITVAGYTDSTGSSKNNQDLSENRAKAVEFSLINNGVKSNRITARGFGSENPAADNSTADGRAQNRRVELHIVPNDDLVSEAQKEQK
ncbi:MAG: OmpA family protein [Nitrospirae bacterium]|nr:OmpA family protein [Nitrospirota bacterium]MBI3352863.1 OmpA family protein [Nitrospirota bacterium]